MAGSAQVGSTLKVDTSEITDKDGLDDVSHTYQWIRNDGDNDSDILGATSSTYALVDADEGKTIKVKVSFTDDAGNEEALTSEPTATAAARPNSPPSLARPRWERRLRRTRRALPARMGWRSPASPTGGSPAAGMPTPALQGATNSTHTLVGADEGKAIKVRVSFTGDAGNAETLTSEATETVKEKPPENSPATGYPSIAGTPKVGETLTADTPGIADEDRLENATFSHQWFAGDSEVQNATGQTYTLTDAEVGKAIKVVVSFTDDADNPETLTSPPSDPVEISNG